MPCLSDEVMAAIADGSLSADERRTAIGHVDECASCRQVLAGVLTLDAAQPVPGEPRRALTPGETVGRYVVLECIGSGSMGSGGSSRATKSSGPLLLISWSGA